MRSGWRIGHWVALAWLAGWGACALAAALAFSPDPLQIDLGLRLLPPGAGHWLGTDALGRDILGRLMQGAGHTLAVTAAATALALCLGATFGLAAGWFGGWVDAGVSTLVNLFWSVPFAVFTVLFIAVLGPEVWVLVLAIGGINWVTSARVCRAEMRRIRRSDHLRAARAAGFSQWQIGLEQVLPTLRVPLLGLAGLAAIETLALESGLAFLGLGQPPPAPTWGGMMAEGLAYVSTAWWVAVIPAVVVVVTLASLRKLADPGPANPARS